MGWCFINPLVGCEHDRMMLHQCVWHGCKDCEHDGMMLHQCVWHSHASSVTWPLCSYVVYISLEHDEETREGSLMWLFRCCQHQQCVVCRWTFMRQEWMCECSGVGWCVYRWTMWHQCSGDQSEHVNVQMFGWVYTGGLCSTSVQKTRVNVQVMDGVYKRWTLQHQCSEDLSEYLNVQMLVHVYAGGLCCTSGLPGTAETT